MAEGQGAAGEQGRGFLCEISKWEGQTRRQINRDLKKLERVSFQKFLQLTQLLYFLVELQRESK